LFYVGGLLGLSAGAMSLGIFKLSGLDPEEVTLYHYQTQKKRREALRSTVSDVDKAKQAELIESVKSMKS